MKELAKILDIEQMAQAIELEAYIFGSATFDDTGFNYSEITL